MKNLIYLTLTLCAFVFFQSCDKDEFLDAPVETRADLPPDIDLGAVYFDGEARQLLRPIYDPYKLENVQAVYNDWKREVDLFGAASNRLPTVQIQPSHYHVKIFPKTAEQLQQLYMDKNITVGSFPFDKVPVQLAQGISAAQYVSLPARYIEPAKEVETLTGEIVREKSFELPVVYAIWSTNLPFYEDLDYEITYSIFKPKEVEAVDPDWGTIENFIPIFDERLLRRAFIDNNSGSSSDKVKPAGIITITDDYLLPGVKIGVPGITVRVQSGSNVYETLTTRDGSFSFQEEVSKNTPVIIQFKGENWYASDDNDELIEWNYASASANMYNKFGNNLECYIAISKHFWDYGHHEISRKLMNGNNVLQFRLYTQEGKEGVGGYTTINYNSCYITVYPWSTSFFMNALFHEMGHVKHWNHTGKTNFYKAGKSLAEGWAVFVGWYMSTKWLESLGKTYSIQNLEPKMQGPCYGPCSKYDHKQSVPHYHDPINYRNSPPYDYQTFTLDAPYKADSKYWYNPFFIDLYDDYNQLEIMWYSIPNISNLHDLYINDRIKDVPVYYIEKIIEEAKTFEDIEKYLNNYVGIFYNQQDLDLLLNCYRGVWVDDTY